MSNARWDSHYLCHGRCPLLLPLRYLCCGHLYSRGPRLTFDAIDTDGDGCLDRDEFVSSAVRLGMNEAEVGKLLSYTACSRSTSPVRFLKTPFHPLIHGISSPLQAAKLFARIDRNSDGVVTRKEFASVLGCNEAGGNKGSGEGRDEGGAGGDDGSEGEGGDRKGKQTKERRGRGKGERKNRYHDIRVNAGSLTLSSRSLTDEGGSEGGQLGAEVTSPVHLRLGNRNDHEVV